MGVTNMQLRHGQQQGTSSTHCVHVPTRYVHQHVGADLALRLRISGGILDPFLSVPGSVIRMAHQVIRPYSCLLQLLVRLKSSKEGCTAAEADSPGPLSGMQHLGHMHV
jgi:hypothetical protein